MLNLILYKSFHLNLNFRELLDSDACNTANMKYNG